jgi:hypothetical protein
MVQGYLLLVGAGFHAKPDDPSILIIKGGPYPHPYFFLIEVFLKPQIRGFENTSNR